MIWPILEARAEMQKYFRSFFGAIENFKICFRDLLTFTSNVLSELVWKLAHRATIVNYFLLNYVKKITTKITTAPGLHNFTQLLQKGKEEKEILSRAKKSMPHSFHRKNLYHTLLTVLFLCYLVISVKCLAHTDLQL